MASGIADARALNFHDVGPQIGEQRPAEGPGPVAGHLYDSEV